MEVMMLAQANYLRVQLPVKPLTRYTFVYINPNIMSRKVYIKAEIRLIVEIEEGQSIYDLMQEMDYEFTPSEDSQATILDTEILDYEITDSK